MHERPPIGSLWTDQDALTGEDHLYLVIDDGFRVPVGRASGRHVKYDVCTCYVVTTRSRVTERIGSVDTDQLVHVSWFAPQSGWKRLA